jgi:hypothetical protein
VRTNPEMVAALRGRDTLVPESLPIESASARLSLLPSNSRRSTPIRANDYMGVIVCTVWSREDIAAFPACAVMCTPPLQCFKGRTESTGCTPPRWKHRYEEYDFIAFEGRHNSDLFSGVSAPGVISVEQAASEVSKRAMK